MPKSIIPIKNTNVEINDSEDVVKILGIYFTKDLRTAGIYNWNRCLTQIEQQTQQLSRRHPSLRGKAILLNSLILSKVTNHTNPDLKICLYFCVHIKTMP